MDWEPRTSLNHVTDQVSVPELTDPPCRGCRYWKPHRTFNRRFDFTGINCCAADLMFSDFSCFEPVETER
jgi:hypothetical protein